MTDNPTYTKRIFINHVTLQLFMFSYSPFVVLFYFFSHFHFYYFELHLDMQISEKLNNYRKEVKKNENRDNSLIVKIKINKRKREQFGEELSKI